MTPLQWALRGLQSVAPAAAATVAERLFFTPPRPRRDVAGSLELVFATARRFELRVERRRVVGWQWGHGPVVYLVHGWGSCGARMAGLVRPLVHAGHSVVTFDAPGHGLSGRGMSSIPEFARSLAAVVEREGPAQAIIAHSLGAAATALAVAWGLLVRRLVFLAPPADPASWVAAFARTLGLRDEIVARMKARSEQRLRLHWSELNVPNVAAGMTVPLLVAHDENDERVAWRDGAAIAAAWPGARLLTTRGLGHSGVVRAPEVVRDVVAFATAQTPEPPWSDETGRLEYELFYRDLRGARAGV
jgi:pimeloyl-ACP methyl ester carboxylesterase